MTRIKYISNLNWSFFERIIHVVNVLIVGILLARYLGPEKLGVLTYVQSYITIFVFLVGLGLDNIAIREIVKNPEKSGEIVGTSFIMMLVMSFAVILIINITSQKFENSEEINLLIAILSLSVIGHVFTIFVSYARAKVNIKPISVTIILSEIILLITKLILIEAQAPLLYFVIIDVLNILIIGVCYAIIYRQSSDQYKSLSFSVSFAKKLLRDSWPLMLSSGMIVLYMRIDQIMIKEMLEFSELGKYAVSVRVSESWYFIPMVITSVFFPLLINAKKSGGVEYKLQLERMFFVVLWIAVFAAIFVSYFSEEIIFNLFGKEFNGSQDVLIIQAFVGIFVSMGYVNGKWIIIENYTKLEMIRSLIGLILNIILNLLLIPVYGINGAAIATLITMLFTSNILFLFNRKTRDLFFLQNKSLFKFKMAINSLKS